MYLIKKRFSDNVYVVGMTCITLSLLMFCGSLLWDKREDSGSSIFIINFSIAVFYFVYRWSNRKKISAEAKSHHRFLFLILSLISAFALNREMGIFENSVNWFSALLVIVCLNCIAFAYFTSIPQWAKHAVSFINGVGVITFLYLSIYLMPLYLVSIVGMILLGISFHTFVPLLFSIYTISMQGRVSQRNNNYWISFGSGIILTIAISITFLLQWNNTVKEINNASRKVGYDLPEWVSVAQNMPHSFLTTKVLKSDFVYSVHNGATELFSLWSISRRGVGESRKHDPLIMIASLFSNKLELDDDTRIKILEVNRDIHKQDEDRLWSGDNLATNFVNTEVKLWPRCNLAYTEKTITVANKKINDWSRQTAEAIYTFYMPEGSVVTALSLWIDGVEQKGIMTTQALADSAYKTIVGREVRDPSIVHWQEGNSVLVRVFPVIAGEERKFKIGITSPLERTNGKLRYENIFFKGPVADNAGEKTVIDFEQSVDDFEMPASFVSKTKQYYNREGKYDPVWGLQINDQGLSGCTFNFDGNGYTLSPYHRKLSPITFNSLYLDVNGSWTKDEFDKMAAFTKEKNVFVYYNKIIKLDGSNNDDLWRKLHLRTFSLFPFHSISEPKHSLVVTKNTPLILGLDELEGSVFMDKTKKFLIDNGQVNVFNLGDDLSLYLRTFKEFRAFCYDNGDIYTLMHHLQNNQFPEDTENDSKVIIHKTDMIIEKTPSATASSGPDHVMRLFAYNHIMQKLGKGLLFARPVEDSLVKEARQAYVVTPVSSLIVLETQKDYDRFGIKDEVNSLSHASSLSKGAVPEPHEWALIGLVVIVLIVVMRRKKNQYAA